MYVTMREIGRYFGVSSHVIGRWLVVIGLRTAERRPSHAAHQGGYVEQGGLGNGGYFYKWHRARTIAALQRAGHRQVAQALPEELNGPFTMVEEGNNSYHILNASGQIAIGSVPGEHNASIILRLLNLWHGHGRKAL